ncbi:hypothetical protein [Flavobacterium sp. M31R6]|uniref:hypothetical protein n=1 Tax=Flavobacterium sp. M31R6 TaxID=2739062 RepID=UPI001568BA5B|nr:hypothetical protein [Flavobacterium sp. M31R6]QKJ62606.1 hypothetical protein HQN62_05480 [Flavobacterium sp. M31R6]
MKKSVIENQFKEKINAREITPSKASWDRLDAMLTVAEKPKRSFKWMYIAASILGFLLIGTLYFNQNKNETVINKDKIVVNESKVIPEIKTVPEKINLPKRVEATKNIEKQLASTETKSKVGSDSVLSNSGIQVAEKEIVQEQQIVIINQEAEQKVVPTKPKYVNADELLASVDNASPRKSSAVAKSNVKVNSNELLTQVDGELDLTFREKAIKTVNQNFKAVKLALSNRNSE